MTTYTFTAGPDNFAGTTGDDVAIVNAAGDLGAGDSFNGAGGVDKLSLAAAGVYDLTVPTFTDIESVVGGASNEEVTVGFGLSGVVIDLSNASSGDRLTLADAGMYTISNVETLLGTAGNDSVKVLSGFTNNSDWKFGGGFDSVSFDDLPNDGTLRNVEEIFGGSADDKLSLDLNSGTASFAGGAGLDSVTLLSVGSLTVVNVETVEGSPVNDTIVLNSAASVQAAGGDDKITGSSGGDTLGGNGGDDSFLGGSGADSIEGNLGVDTIYGEDGADTIDGGGDNDSIVGGDGDDFITINYDDTVLGGSGADLFLLDPTADMAINDFSVGDVIKVQVSQGSFLPADIDLSTPGLLKINTAGTNATFEASVAISTSIAPGDLAVSFSGSYGYISFVAATTPTGGNDTLVLPPLAGTSFDALDGNDNVSFGPGASAGTVVNVETLVTGAGGDQIEFERLAVPVDIDLGDGADGLTISGVYTSSANFYVTNVESLVGSDDEDDVSLTGTAQLVDLGDGDDILSVEAAGPVTIVGVETIDGSFNSDSLSIGGFADYGSYSINLDYGADSLTLDSPAFYSSLDVDLGEDNDQIKVVSALLDTYSLADIYGGTGDDVLLVDNSVGSLIDLSFASLGISDNDVQYHDFENVDASAATVGMMIKGNSDDNRLKGGSGADTLVGGDGIDTLIGGGGADRFVYADAGESFLGYVDEIQGFAPGTDKIGIGAIVGANAFTFLGPLPDLATAQSALTATFTAGAVIAAFVSSTSQLWVDANADGTFGASDLVVSLSGVGSLATTDLDIAAPPALPTFTPNDDDKISTAPLAGNSVDGGTGLDKLSLPAAASIGSVTNIETLLSGGGADKVTVVEHLSGMAIDLGGGTDRLDFYNPAGSASVTNVEIIVGSDGGDVLSFDGVAALASGDYGDDSMLGGAFADTLLGDDGADSLAGGAGADLIFGDGGTNQLAGDDGNDTVVGGDQADMIDGGADNDQLFGGLEADSMTGGDGNDMLAGGDGDDELAGDLGADTLFGELGDDTLDGGGGGDMLLGGDGLDLLLLDVGATAWGGADADSFVIANAPGTVMIADFKVGIDTLNLVNFSGVYANEAAAIAAATTTGYPNGIAYTFGSVTVQLLGVSTLTAGDLLLDVNK